MSNLTNFSKFLKKLLNKVKSGLLKQARWLLGPRQKPHEILLSVYKTIEILQIKTTLGLTKHKNILERTRKAVAQCKQTITCSTVRCLPFNV